MITFEHPLHGAGTFLQGFGGDSETYSRFGLLGHNGVDWGCKIGTPVFASAPGTVTKIQTDPDGYGLHIRLSHYEGGKEVYRTIYAHLSEVTCKLNQTAPAGALIGRSGSSGFSTTPHLHFEIRPMPLSNNGYNGAVDPAPLIWQVNTAVVMQNSDAENVTNMENIPESGTATVTWQTLSIRTKPEEGNESRIGYWIMGAKIEYDAIIKIGGDIWMVYSIFGREHYSALFYDNSFTCSTEV